MNRNNNTYAKLLECVSADGAYRHLEAFQAIADENDGIRTSGTPGYDASVDYVAEKMEAAGYDVTIQPFEFQAFIQLSPSILEQVAPPPTGPIVNNIFSYSGSVDVTAPVTALPAAPADATPGCEPSDFAGFTAGNIALIQRGACTFAIKATNAYNAGAAGVVIYNNQPGVINGTLGNDFTLDIGVTAVTQAVGEQLAATPGLVLRLKTDTFRGMAETYNVFAETPGGDPDNVVMVGAHLDSVDAGPGINDNGSGSAALLHVAEMMSKVKVENKVRFAWWGAEEFGLVGSDYYVYNLTDEERAQIALYLNYDMIASPNYVRFVYDGDGSAFGLAGPTARRRSRSSTRTSTPRVGSRGSRRRSASAPTTRRSSTSASRSVACSPAPRASRRPSRRRSTVARQGSPTTPATTWPATPSTTSTWRSSTSTSTPSPSRR
jgi:Zn-dependent M28 family amino/carboxypeptidase